MERRLLLTVVLFVPFVALSSFTCGGPDAVFRDESSFSATYASPYGASTQVDVYFGYDTVVQRVRIGWRKVSTGECSFDTLTSWPNNGLPSTFNALINLPDTSDSFEMPVNIGAGIVNAYMSCPDGTHTFVDFMWNGEHLTVQGNNGADYMVCNRPGTSCYGNSGNDYIVVEDNRSVLVDGGYDDDIIHSTVPSTQLRMDGGPGQDCLQPTDAQHFTPALFQCGSSSGGVSDRSYGNLVGSFCYNTLTPCP